MSLGALLNIIGLKHGNPDLTTVPSDSGEGGHGGITGLPNRTWDPESYDIPPPATTDLTSLLAQIGQSDKPLKKPDAVDKSHPLVDKLKAIGDGAKKLAETAGAAHHLGLLDQLRGGQGPVSGSGPSMASGAGVMAPPTQGVPQGDGMPSALSALLKQNPLDPNVGPQGAQPQDGGPTLAVSHEDHPNVYHPDTPPPTDKRWDDLQKIVEQSQGNLMAAIKALHDLPPPPKSKGPTLGTKDLIWAIPALIAAFSGSHMQDLAGGLLGGAAQGIQQRTDTANQNAMQGWQYQQQQAKVGVEAAQQGVEHATSNLRDYAQESYRRNQQSSLDANRKETQDQRRAETQKGILNQKYPVNATSPEVERTLKAKQQAAKALAKIPGFEDTAQISDDDIKKEVEAQTKKLDDHTKIVNSHFNATQFARTSALAQTAFTSTDAIKYLNESLKYTDDPEQKKAILADIADYKSGKLTPRALSDQEKRQWKSIDAQLKVQQDTISKLWQAELSGQATQEDVIALSVAEAEQERLLGLLGDVGTPKSPIPGAQVERKDDVWDRGGGKGDIGGGGSGAGARRGGRLPQPAAKTKDDDATKNKRKRYNALNNKIQDSQDNIDAGIMPQGVTAAEMQKRVDLWKKERDSLDKELFPDRHKGGEKVDSASRSAVSSVSRGVGSVLGGGKSEGDPKAQAAAMLKSGKMSQKQYDAYMAYLKAHGK